MLKKEIVNRIKELVRERRVNGQLVLSNGNVLFIRGGKLHYAQVRKTPTVSSAYVMTEWQLMKELKKSEVENILNNIEK